MPGSSKPETKPGTRAAMILAACALAASTVYHFEGDVRRGYRDPIGIVTACSGHTKTAKAGKEYSADECAALLTFDLVEHGQGIDNCIRVSIPVETRAAFTSFAFNVGVNNFCSSTAAKKLNAGDLAGACAELSRWTKAGRKELPGLVERRKAERALCEKGLSNGESGGAQTQAVNGSTP